MTKRRVTLTAIWLLPCSTTFGCGSYAQRARVPEATTADVHRPEVVRGRDGKRVVDAFLAGETKPIWRRFGEKLRQLTATNEALDALQSRMASELGAEESVERERVHDENGLTVYERVARFQTSDNPFVDLIVGIDTANTIQLFWIRPHAATPSEVPQAAPTTKLAYLTKAALRLPFDGTWTVTHGGRTIASNYHVVSRRQRFAYDFVVERDGATHAGNGESNSDYYAYGRPIVAPAPGTVVDVKDGVAENKPGEMKETPSPFGNHVVVDFGDGEYAFFAHFIPGSVRVHRGDKVVRGAELGRCGNSGHSSEPHLHFHMQTEPTSQRGEGLPAQFRDYVANGNPVAIGEPVRHDRVEPRSNGLGTHVLFTADSR